MFGWTNEEKIEKIRVMSVEFIELSKRYRSSGHSYLTNRFIFDLVYLNSSNISKIINDLDIDMVRENIVDYTDFLEGTIADWKEEFRPEHYEPYINRMTEGAANFTNFLENRIIGILQKIKRSRTDLARLRNIIEFLRRLKEGLIIIRISVTRFRRLGSTLKTKSSRLEAEKSQLLAQGERVFKDIEEERRSRQEEVGGITPQEFDKLSTFEKKKFLHKFTTLALIDMYRVAIKILSAFIVNINRLKDQAKKLYVDRVANEFNKDLDRRLKELQRYVDNSEKHLTITFKFLQLYEANDQQGMYVYLNGVGYIPNYEIFMGNGVIAYMGVCPYEHDEFTGAWGLKTIDISPEKYATYFLDIFTRGYRPSKRPLSVDLFDMRTLENIYFYTNPHQQYGGDHALVLIDCSGYCIFKSRGEYIIITKKRIPVARQRLWVRPADKFFNQYDREFQETLINELKRLKVPFEIKDY